MKILYLHTMLKNIDERSGISLAEIPPNDVTENILEIIQTHDGFRESSTFGAKGLGDPEEYEKLILEDETSSRTFEYFNRGISYMSEIEEDRLVFQVFTYFMTLQNREKE